MRSVCTEKIRTPFRTLGLRRSGMGHTGEHDGRKHLGTNVSVVDKFKFVLCGVLPREKTPRTGVGGADFAASRNGRLKDHAPGETTHGTGTDQNINADAEDGDAIDAATAASGIDTVSCAGEGGSLTPTSPTLVGTPPVPTDHHESLPVSALASAQPTLIPTVPTPAAGEPEKRRPENLERRPA